MADPIWRLKCTKISDVDETCLWSRWSQIWTQNENLKKMKHVKITARVCQMSDVPESKTTYSESECQPLRKSSRCTFLHYGFLAYCLIFHLFLLNFPNYFQGSKTSIIFRQTISLLLFFSSVHRYFYFQYLFKGFKKKGLFNELF